MRPDGDPRRILLVFGTRPEAIKLAPLAARIAAAPGLRALVCVTGQHRGLLDQVLDAFAIRPDADLAVMRPGQGLSEATAAILAGLPAVLAALRPERVLVQGDTTTTFAAALAAFHARIPVGHVEAGLRTGRLDAPFPEEANRRLTTLLADLHFAPTPGARDNLLREGVPEGRIHVTGNTGIDALLDGVALLEADPARRAAAAAAAGLPPADPRRRLVLVTAHRRESLADGGLARVALGLRRLADREDVELALPLHPHPAVEQALRGALGGHPRIHLLPPLGYLPFIELMRRAALIITDSGGVQEEAATLGRPVLVIRAVTERTEALDAGTACLVGTDPDRVFAAAAALLDAPARAPEGAARRPFGDGRAAERILAVLAGPHGPL